MNLKRTLKALFAGATIALISACTNNSIKSENESSETAMEKLYEEKSEVKPLLSDMIEIVSVESGWYNEQRPQIKIKFCNKSGNAISDFVKIKYQFVENEEVFDEGNIYLHSGADVDWDNGLSKSKTITSNYGYPYGGYQHTITAKVCFEDNSPIWQGKVSQKVIY